MAGRPKLVSVNPAITCSLCKGYLINAMRLCRCMHAFCRSCIHRYLDTSSTCPTCQQRVFRSRMDVHMLPDHELQSIVYRVVPGLYADEMRRRREFYENSDERNVEHTEERGFPERVILSDKDKVSVVLAYRDNEEYPKLFLELAAAMPVSVLLNFLRDKCKPLPTLVVHLILEQKGVGTKEAPDRLLLDPDFTIIDVCYIAKYSLQGPLKLSFTFVQFDPESFKDKRLLESSAMSESSVLKKSLNHRYRDEKVNGHSGVPNQAVKNVQYTKVKMETKSIVLSKNPAADSAVNSMKTYSRNAGSNGGNGNICQLTDGAGVVAGANASEGDSTEEEVDSWDSNVSTTIDSLTNSSQHSSQQQQPASSAGKPNKAAAAAAAAAAATAATATNAGAVQSGPPPASKSSKHSKSSAGASSSIHGNDSPLIVARPQSLRIDAMREKPDKPAGKQAISPVVQQSAPVGHHKRASQEKKTHHHHHHHHHKNHSASSTSTASASTVAGKPPTVLKIKLNTSPTTSETLTITSPPIRETRLKALEYPAVTSIKIKPIIAPPSPPSSSSSPSSSSRETRAGSVESGGRKKRRSEDKDHRTMKDRSPSEDEPVVPKKSKKAKTKKTTNQNTQAVINDTAYVSDQPKDLLSTSNFGWGDSSLWESQLRIPSPLTVPLTVSVARRKAKQAKSQAPSFPLPPPPPPTSSSFLEENFSLKKNKVVVKPAHNRIWRKRRHVSPPPVPVKLPPPDFEMSSTLSAVLEAVKNDRFGEVLSSPQRAATSPSSSPLRDCYFSKPAADHNDLPSRRQSDTDHFLDSGVRPGSSSSGDINADVFRMEFPVAAINPPTTAVSPKFDRSQSCTSSSPQSQVCQESSRRLSSTSTSSSPSSCPEVKFSIHSILSNDCSPPQNRIKQKNESKEMNIQESIEMFITNISKFFWALEASKGRVSLRMSKAFLAKKVALGKILTLLRKLTIVVAPNQIERVLQLESAIHKYFQTDPFVGLASSEASERIRSPLESLKPDTLRRLEQNDVKLTPIYPEASSGSRGTVTDRWTAAAEDACVVNGSDGTTSIVRQTPVSELAAEWTLGRQTSGELGSWGAEVELVPHFELPLGNESAAPETNERSVLGDLPPPSDLEAETSGSENGTIRSDDTLESLGTPKQEVILDSEASIPRQEQTETCSSSIEPCEDAEAALAALLDSVERSVGTVLAKSREDELTEESDEDPLRPQGTSLLEPEPQSRVSGTPSDGGEPQTQLLEAPTDEKPNDEAPGDEFEAGTLVAVEDRLQADQNTPDRMTVNQNASALAAPRASATEVQEGASSELRIDVRESLSEPSNGLTKLSTDGSDLADSEILVESSENLNDRSESSLETTGAREGSPPVQKDNPEFFVKSRANGADLIQLDVIETELDRSRAAEDDVLDDEIDASSGGTEFPVTEVGCVADPDCPMDATEDSVESSASSFMDFETIRTGITDRLEGTVEDRNSEVRVDPIEVDVNEVVDPHVNEANFGGLRTENDPKNERKEHEARDMSRQTVCDGSFGLNSCKSVVPYVPVKRNDSYCWASDALRSELGKSAIHYLFPLRVPRIPFVENEVSTCDPAPKTHRTGLELVPYVPRSDNPIENLFRLSGLIPERVPIPSPVHDYIMRAGPTGIPNSGKQTKTHSLLDFLKLQQKSHVVQQNTSPNFGDIDMDVHRWEEVDELGAVAPPSGVANVPGSLNVH